MSPRHWIHFWCYGAAAFVLVSPTANVADAQQLKRFDAGYLESPRGGPDLERAEDELLRLTNDFREEHERSRLKWNKHLGKAAAYFAAYMARTDKFGHEVDGSKPADRITAYEYDYCIEAENIAYQMNSRGFSTGELARKLFESWKNSPPHRENMLDADLAEVGIAIGYSPESQRYYAVQDFGRPKSAAIHFEVTNRTDETLHYTVKAVGRYNDEPKPIELPPGWKMTHSRCRPATIDWQWTKEDDRLEAKDRREIVVTKTGAGYHVAEQQSDQKLK
jgi:uncharacterized protein YkwD